MKTSSCSLFLFTALILINLSSCRLNLFRPFASSRQVKSAAAADLEPDKLIKLQPTNENQQPFEQVNQTKPDARLNEQSSDGPSAQSFQPDDEQELSLGQFLSRKISQAINEIEMKLEDQLINNKVNESQFENPDALLSELQSAEHREPVRPVDTASEIKSSNSSIDGSQLAVKTVEASSSGSPDAHKKSNNESTSTETSRAADSEGRIDKSTSGRADNSTSTPTSVTSVASVDRALGEATTELSIKELSRLRSTFRTFSTILDFLINVFDEFAEAIVSRAATLLINSFFDRASLFLLGI